MFLIFVVMDYMPIAIGTLSYRRLGKILSVAVELEYILESFNTPIRLLDPALL